MRLLPRPPETPPSLETWLGRDVPQEREMAGGLMEKMGREKSLEALLFCTTRKKPSGKNDAAQFGGPELRFCVSTSRFLLQVYQCLI